MASILPRHLKFLARACYNGRTFPLLPQPPVVDIFLRSVQNPDLLLMCVLLAALPVAVWMAAFGLFRRQRLLPVLAVFAGGSVAGCFILAYQYFWGTQFNFIFFSVQPQDFSSVIRGTDLLSPLLASLFVYLSVGFLEEYGKHLVVRFSPRKLFTCVDDVIDFSIVAALGFSFLENIGYFLIAANNGGGTDLFALFVVRSLFVMFVHILCSGVYGYFYGLGYFATPLLEKQHAGARWRLFLPNILHKIFHFRKERVFADEMATFGLLCSMILHGLYDFLLHINLSLGRIGSTELYLHLFVLPMMLVLGFSWLQNALSRTEDQEKFGYLRPRSDEVVPPTPTTNL